MYLRLGHPPVVHMSVAVQHVCQSVCRPTAPCYDVGRPCCRTLSALKSCCIASSLHARTEPCLRWTQNGLRKALLICWYVMAIRCRNTRRVDVHQEIMISPGQQSTRRTVV